MRSPAPTTAAVRTYRRTIPAGWWLRKRHYFFYVVREFTALPMAVWLLWLLFEIRSADASGYSPPRSTGFVIFSVVCLLFSTYHSYTFLKLAGVIMHLKVLDKPVPPRLIVFVMFFMWALASVVIGAVLIGFGK